MTSTPSASPTGRRYLRAAAVRARYGDISDVTLWRWVRDPALGFPQPIYITPRMRVWDEADLDRFDAMRAAATEPQAA